MTVFVLTEKNVRQLGQRNGMVLCVQRVARSLWQYGQRTPVGQRPSMNHCSARLVIREHPHQVDQRDAVAVVLSASLLSSVASVSVACTVSYYGQSCQAPGPAGSDSDKYTDAGGGTANRPPGRRAPVDGSATDQ